MRIAHVVCVIPPYGGGLGRVADAYARGLVGRGHAVTVFVPAPAVLGQREQTPYTLEYVKPWFRLGLGAFIPQLVWKLRGFEIVHLHFPFFGAAFVTLLFKIVHPRVRLFVTYHQDLRFNGWREWFYRVSRWLVVPLLCRLSERIIVSSRDYAESSYIAPCMKRFPGKFIELPFGIPEGFGPHPVDASLRETLGIPEKHTVVTFVGGLDSAHYFKGVSYLIEAISLLRNSPVSAVIVGSGNLLTTYKEKALAAGIADRIHFTGHVSDAQLVSYMNLADMVVLPSTDRNEAFGLVLIEAMACGKPVIASDLPGVRAVVREGVNGWLAEPKNAEQLASCIKKLMDHPAQAHAFGMASLDLVTKHYQWPVIIEQLVTLYQSPL